MKNKNKLLCLPAPPLLLILTAGLQYICLLLVVGLLLFLIARSIKRKKEKLIAKDNSTLILLVVLLSLITFVTSGIIAYSIGLNPNFENANYLLSYVFSLAVLFVGFVILKSFSAVEIKKITLVILGILLFLFVALYCWKIFIGLQPPAGVNSKNGFQPPATTGFTNPIGGGCGGMSIF